MLRLKHSGFTLIELIFVTLILAVLLAVSIPRFSQTAERLRSERAAFELVQLLRLAREHSITQAKPFLWQWEEESRSVNISALDITGAVLDDQDIFNQGGFHNLIIVNVEREEEPSECQCVHFFPDGTSVAAEIKVGIKEHVYSITVDATTAQAKLTAGISSS